MDGVGDHSIKKSINEEAGLVPWIVLVARKSKTNLTQLRKQDGQFNTCDPLITRSSSERQAKNFCNWTTQLLKL